MKSKKRGHDLIHYYNALSATAHTVESASRYLELEAPSLSRIFTTHLWQSLAAALIEDFGCVMNQINGRPSAGTYIAERFGVLDTKEHVFRSNGRECRYRVFTDCEGCWRIHLIYSLCVQGHVDLPNYYRHHASRMQQNIHSGLISHAKCEGLIHMCRVIKGYTGRVLKEGNYEEDESTTTTSTGRH